MQEMIFAKLDGAIWILQLYIYVYINYAFQVSVPYNSKEIVKLDLYNEELASHGNIKQEKQWLIDVMR